MRRARRGDVRDRRGGHPLKRVLVTGSRDWTDAATIRMALKAEWEPGAVLVHGAGRGADRIAQEVWVSFGGRFHDEPHPADWDRFGKRAGPIRNREMVDAGADVCLAFILNDSPGASRTAMWAAKAGIPTKEFRR